MAHVAEHHPPSSILHPCPLLLAGPTAVGKSEIALCLAEELGGEIISVDSMQVYRGMDIGTAKASAADRARVRHHLVDGVEISEPFDAAQFLALARKAVIDIQGRGRVPILCGGTGLYFKVFLDGLSEAPAADDALRAELESIPLPDLLRELAERDPVTYERIDRQNPRRVLRAVAVIRLTGKPFSAQRVIWQSPSTASGPLPACIGLRRSQEDLHQRIDARVESMFRHGWVGETENLLRGGLAENRTAMQALGYRQIAEHLNGARSLAATIELVKLRTRQFARRQMTWFRRQLPLNWINLEPQSEVEGTVQTILSAAGVSAKDTNGR